jgi:hypothetical protein
MTLNCDTPVTAAGNPVLLVTVNDVAPEDGDDARVVAALSANSSIGISAG